MSLPAPVLDDRTFEQLFADVRRLIPRFTPEWTDHNDSDPGIALLQLFSWLTDATLFRMNQVPELHYVKFLELLGIRLRAAMPAQADLVFETSRKDVPEVFVPARTQVAAPGDDGPLIFETVESFAALTAKLTAVQNFDGFGYTVVTKANETDEQTFDPFGPRASSGAALLLGFDSPVDFTGQTFRLQTWVAGPPERGSGLSCESEALDAPPPSTLVWEFHDSAVWRPLNVVKDGTRAFTRDGFIALRGPGSRARKSVIGPSSAAPLYWLRCRVVQSGYQQSPKLSRVLPNAIRATQAVTVVDEALGASNGQPNQQFSLASAPVVPLERPVYADGPGGVEVKITSLRLEVNEGSAENNYRPWLEVEDFLGSGPDDPHYAFDHATGAIAFGDGKRGRVPLANPAFPASNIVAREYRTGGGSQGNVGAGAIAELQSFVEGISGVSNPRAAFGGSDEETLDDAKSRAASTLKSKGRAVTADDFESLAKETRSAAIARAAALPNTNPCFPGAPIPGAVTVIVVPDTSDAAPQPTEATLRAVRDWLDQKRLITTELHVVGPKYRFVSVEVNLIVLPTADLGEVQGLAIQALETYLHPLRGGDDPSTPGWPFGGAIFYSKVYRLLLDIPGVDRIDDNHLFFALDGDRQPACRDVPIESGELVASREHSVRVEYDYGAAP